MSSPYSRRPTRAWPPPGTQGLKLPGKFALTVTLGLIVVGIYGGFQFLKGFRDLMYQDPFHNPVERKRIKEEKKINKVIQARARWEESKKLAGLTNGETNSSNSTTSTTST